MILVLLSAVCWLQQPDPSKVDEWVRQLGSDDLGVREAAAKALLECGEKVLPLLEKHEKSADAEVRARIADVRRRLTPFAMDEVFRLAEKALKEDSDKKDWLPPLLAQVAEYMERLGEDAEAESRREAQEALAGAFDESREILREMGDRPQHATYLVKQARGRNTDFNILLVCESAEFVRIEDTLLICLGDVKAEKIDGSVVIAKGQIEASKLAERNVLHSSGTLRCAGRVTQCTVNAVGGAVIQDSARNVYINTPDRKLEKSDGDRKVTKERLPKR